MRTTLRALLKLFGKNTYGELSDSHGRGVDDEKSPVQMNSISMEAWHLQHQRTQRTMFLHRQHQNAGRHTVHMNRRTVSDEALRHGQRHVEQSTVSPLSSCSGPSQHQGKTICEYQGDTRKADYWMRRRESSGKLRQHLLSSMA